MARKSGTFSESWYRVADQNIRLRTGVHVRRQNFRGERWFVLENPFSNQYFRLRPSAYEFVARLNRGTTVEKVWEECLERFPEEAPGQDEVIRLLGQLYQSNLLEYDVADDAAQLFERFRKRRERELKARLTNIMFMRFPLFDPDRFLVRSLPLVGKLLGRAAGLVWLFVVGWAIKTGIDHSSELLDQSQSVLAPGNLLLLYAAMAITKTLHEFGHAYFCRKFGGEVHTMGIMLLIFTPIPYMDATSSWGFRSKWKRALVGGAGMIVEVFVAAIALFVWANTGAGTLHNLAYNMIFVASVSTILFNINPLLRFDGYYILSDLLEIPNLHQKATKQLQYYFKRYIFGLKDAQPGADNRTQGFWITVFGILSHIYRIFVFSGILLFVADRFLLLGVIMAITCLTGWIIVPLAKFSNYLLTSPELSRQRPRAIMATAVLVFGILGFLQWVPFPYHFRAPGIFQARERTEIVSETAGAIAEIAVPNGARVTTGQLLLRMENRELATELAAATARKQEIEARMLEAREQAVADLEPLESLLESAERNLAKVNSDIATLDVRARQDGIWIAPELEDTRGRWVSRGTPLGLIVDPAAFEFTATVVQADVDNLFTQEIAAAEVRVPGQAESVVLVGKPAIIPAEHQLLPSSALGWARGGNIQTDASDPEGRRAAEPFFEVRADVINAGAVPIFHGRSAKIRFPIDSQPLLPRWIRRLRQLLQKRYQI